MPLREAPRAMNETQKINTLAHGQSGSGWMLRTTGHASPPLKPSRGLPSRSRIGPEPSCEHRVGGHTTFTIGWYGFPDQSRCTRKSRIFLMMTPQTFVRLGWTCSIPRFPTEKFSILTMHVSAPLTLRRRFGNMFHLLDLKTSFRRLFLAFGFLFVLNSDENESP